MKKYLFVLLLLLTSAKDYAQTKLNTYQYWFDEDFTGNVTQAIAPVNSFILSGPIDVNSLSAGLHSFNVRFKDDSSRWSTVSSNYFFKSAADIVGYEYWFDNNYASRVTENVTSTQTLNLSSSINIDNIEPGYHSFNIRLKSSSNTWSTTKTQSFIRLGQNGSGSVITAYRYWFDQIRDTTEVRMSVSQPKSSVIINDRLNTLQLDTGFHFIYLQTMDTSGLWSSVISRRFRRIGKPRIDFITPNEGGNTGDVSINIFGDGFFEGTRVKLTKETDTISVPDSLLVNLNGNRLVAIVNFTGKIPGVYNIVVEINQPRDTVLNLNNAFKLVNGEYCNIGIQILGPSTIRSGSNNTYDVIVTNCGNTNVYNVPVWITFPENLKPEIKFPIQEYHSPDFDLDSIPDLNKNDSLFSKELVRPSKSVPILIPVLEPKQSTVLPLNLRPNGSTNPCLLSASTTEPWGRCFQRYSNCNDCIKYAIFAGLPLIPYPGTGCLVNVIQGGDNVYQFYQQEKYTLMSAQVADVILNCTADILFASKIVKYASLVKAMRNIANFRNGFSVGDNLGRAIYSCYEFFEPNKPPVCKDVRIVTSVDPNEKYGPIAFDTTNKYITNDNPFNYVIHFENDSSATAPALLVIIKDTLNKSVFDLSTFKLGNITIGDTTISVPSGLKNYSTDIDLSGIGTSFICHLDATLDTAKGIATWKFTTLNLSNYLPATGVLDGFLPANKKSPEGQGAVSFSIKAFDTIPLNTAVSNKAYIYFDNNAPIATGTWRNKIDNVKPQSSMLPLPPFSDSLLTLRWSGNDAESGIYSYSIYYSINGRDFNLLASNISSYSLEFKGEIDSTYSFYSIATDKAGNRELGKNSCESITTIRYSKYICPGGSTFFYVSDTTAGNTYQWQLNTGSGFSNVANSVVYGGANNDTLSLTNVPSSYYGYEYRCIITNGANTKTSIDHHVVVKNTWTGTVSTAWENAGNWSCGTVPDINTDVIIKNTASNQPILNSNGVCRSLKQEVGTNVKVNNNFRLLISGAPR